VRPLPVGRKSHRPSVCRLHPLHTRSVLVDSHHLDGLLRSGARACCSPIRTGFAAFPGACTRSLASEPEGPAPSGRETPTVPRNAVRTLRSIPLVDSRTASLRPLPSCRCRPPLERWSCRSRSGPSGS
jgi:hypothetical protein